MKFSPLLVFIALGVVIFSCGDSAAQIPSGATFWLRADSGVVVSSNNVVTSWKDQSGTTKSAFQSLPVSQPTLIPLAINSLPVIHFDGRFDYMDCAPIFPVAKDYTVTIVARIGDLTRINYLFSGNTHAIFTGGSAFPLVRNDTSPASLLTSKIAASPNQPFILTITYSENTHVGLLYINGELADSAVIGPNKDSKIYLGAFQGVASFLGDLAEIVLYSKALPEAERKQLEDYLYTKYAIAPTSAPDSIYTAVPKHLQFYPRDADDSATVRISGNYTVAGFDSIYLKLYKDGVLTSRTARSLKYESGKASFDFSPRIHAELSEYSFLLGVKSATVDKQIGFRDSIVCGDVILISGQSNSIANTLGYTNEFFRTFGNNQSTSLGDTSWALSSTAISFGPGPVSGSWGVRLQEDIMNTYKIPTCVINSGVGATGIALHLPDELNHENIATIYGNMLYRAIEAGVASKAKAFFWYQGESDILQGYADKFRILHNAWKEDYSNLKKIYVMQTRPSSCIVDFSADVRNLLRTLQDSFPDMESVATMGLPGHDGCHFSSEGYLQLGDQLFRLLARDFYGSTDATEISSPNILQAYYTNSAKTQIGLTFVPKETRFIIPHDTVVGGIPASIKDYFYLNDIGEVVQSVSTSGNKIFIDLLQPSSSRLITYLPDKYYNHTSAVYEGPWLENSRGIGAFSFYHIPIVDSAQAGILQIDQINDLSLTVFPNPSAGKFGLHYRLLQPGIVTITISDLLGRTFAYSNKEKMEAGEHEVAFDANTLGIANGIYLCSLHIGNTKQKVKLLIER